MGDRYSRLPRHDHPPHNAGKVEPVARLPRSRWRTPYEVGRMHLFNNLAKVILDMKSGTLGRPPKTAMAAASSSVTGKTFYWRGFVSDRGSVSRPAVHRGRGRGGRGGQHSSGRGDLHASGGRGRARPALYQRPGLPRGGHGKNHLSN